MESGSADHGRTKVAATLVTVRQRCRNRPDKNITAHATTTPQKVKKLTEKQRKEAKNAKDRERRAKKKADAEFGRNV